MKNKHCNVPFCESSRLDKNGFCSFHLKENRQYKHTKFRELLPLWAFKRCNIHGLLHFDFVYQHKSTKSFYCKKCQKSYVNKIYNPDKAKMIRSERYFAKKSREMQSIYGITLQDYKNFLLKQNDKCAICLISIYDYQKIRTDRKFFDIDHCHISGKVRGLLCHQCNVAIGLIGDSIENSKRLTTYLYAGVKTL